MAAPKVFFLIRRYSKHACVLSIAFVLIILLCGPAFSTDLPTRPSPLAGYWYPGDKAELSRMIKGFMANVSPAGPKGQIKALIVPHAGYVYSGQVAAHAFSLLKMGEFKTVILVGPSHRGRFKGVSLNMQNYETPLGRLDIDLELAARIKEKGKGLIAGHPEVHEEEHCLEIEMPFLQTVLGDVKIVPLLMGSHDLETCRALAEVLADAAADPEILLLCSTDLSHFHSGKKARLLDKALIEHVRNYTPEKLHQGLVEGKFEACGGSALAAVMMAAQKLGASKSTILNYAHSGDVTGDNSRVVGYLSAVLTIPEKNKSTDVKTGVDPCLKPADQKRLLDIARQAISAKFNDTVYVPQNMPESLMVSRGAFVTLKINGHLRGCIGCLVSDQPLPETIASMAQAAAFHDPRFQPLSKSEFNKVEVEISVLTPFEQVTDVNDIKIGTHGLLIVHGRNQGLLLPQVPVEQGWNRQEFLESTCLKAGLPPDAWNEKQARLFSFSAQVFHEPGKE